MTIEFSAQNDISGATILEGKLGTIHDVAAKVQNAMFTAGVENLPNFIYDLAEQIERELGEDDFTRIRLDTKPPVQLVVRRV